jgi:cytochrome bd-type quinol oxidase subunit 2
MFLISYKGYNLVDNIVSSVAGFAAVFISFFPTNMLKKVPVTIVNEGCLLFSLPENGIRNTVHYVSSGLFFFALAYMSIFLFTKSHGEKTKEKKLRNKVFRTCGVIIICSIVLIALYGFFGESNDRLNELKPVFWLEWLALFAFGISWLVKAKLVLKDHSRVE